MFYVRVSNTRQYYKIVLARLQYIQDGLSSMYFLYIVLCRMYIGWMCAYAITYKNIYRNSVACNSKIRIWCFAWLNEHTELMFWELHIVCDYKLQATIYVFCVCACYKYDTIYALHFTSQNVTAKALNIIIHFFSYPFCHFPLSLNYSPSNKNRRKMNKNHNKNKK